MIDPLQVLDDELFRTPHDAYLCRPMRRSVVAAAAAEIRRLRALHERDQRMLADMYAATLTTATRTE